jgi:hypothetical protein
VEDFFYCKSLDQRTTSEAIFDTVNNVFTSLKLNGVNASEYAHRRRSNYDGQKVWSCNSNQRVAPNITATHCVIHR